MNILFVCTGNTCRSVIAEFLLKHLSSAHCIKFDVKSAGVHAASGIPIAKIAKDYLMKEGITPPEGGFSKSVNKDLIDWADIILTMEKSHKEELLLRFPEVKDKITLLSEYVGKGEYEILDPLGASWEAYEKVTSDIKELILALLKKLKYNNYDEEAE